MDLEYERDYKLGTLFNEFTYPKDVHWIPFVKGFLNAISGRQCMYQDEFKQVEFVVYYQSKTFLKSIGDLSGIPFILAQEEAIFTLTFVGSNAIDFLGLLGYYNNKKNMEFYDTVQCKYIATDSTTVIPNKQKQSDVGYDLTIVKKVKVWNNDTTLFNTCLKVQVEDGYYLEVVPRSSLSKSGYMLANSIGIIDPGYTGEILVALTKVDQSAPDIELPFRCCQIIIRKQYHADFSQSLVEFGQSSRNAGSFGSTI